MFLTCYMAKFPGSDSVYIILFWQTTKMNNNKKKTLYKNCPFASFQLFEYFSYFFLFSTFSCQIKKRVLKKVVIESNRYQRVTKESIKSFLRKIKKSIKSCQLFSESSKSQERVFKESSKSHHRVRVIDGSSQTYQRVHKGSKRVIKESKSHERVIKMLYDFRFLLFAKY